MRLAVYRLLSERLSTKEGSRRMPSWELIPNDKRLITRKTDPFQAQGLLASA